MRERVPLVLSVILFLSSTILEGQCIGSLGSTLFVGGQVAPAFRSSEGPFFIPTFYLDRAHPAAATIAATRVDFSTADATFFAIQFAVARPTGSGYVIAAQTPAFAVSPPANAAAIATYTLPLNPPLVFSRGDLLAVISTAQLAVTYADRPGGYGVRDRGIDSFPTSFDESFFLSSINRYSIAVVAQGLVSCTDVPPAELLLPAVGDVVGAAHFVTRLDAAFHFPDALPVDQAFINTTLFDRLSNPGVVHIVGARLPLIESFHSDSLAGSLGISPPFFGPLTLQFPVTASAGMGGKSIVTNASATIVALNSCSGGETGSVISAVGCSGIGRTIEFHIHVPADHRANLGIASAQLASCGVSAAATEVTVNGFLTEMPAQSIQLNNITGPGSPLPNLVGVTDAIVIVKVTDNRSRVAAYVSILDNKSQDSVVVTGLVTD